MRDRRGRLRREGRPGQDGTAPESARGGRLAWFRFYPGDWLRETRGWSLVQRAIYLELRLVQWMRGRCRVTRTPSARSCVPRRASGGPRGPFSSRAPRVAGGRRRNPEFAAIRAEHEEAHRGMSAGGRRGNETRWGRRSDEETM